jgi:hypothetical protein
LLYFALNDLTHRPKVMVHYSPLIEIAATNVAEAENLDVVDSPAGMARTIGGGEVPGASDGEGPALSAGGTENSA